MILNINKKKYNINYKILATQLIQKEPISKDITKRKNQALEYFCNKEFKYFWNNGQRYCTAIPSIDENYFNYINSTLIPRLNEIFKHNIPSVLDIGANSNPIILMLNAMGFSVPKYTVLEVEDGFNTVSSLLKENKAINIVENSNITPLNTNYKLAVYMGPDFQVQGKNSSLSTAKKELSYQKQKLLFNQIVNSLDPKGLFFVSFHTPLEHTLYSDFVDTTPCMSIIAQSSPISGTEENTRQSNNGSYLILEKT